jgi:hypothetical protein
VTGRVRWGRATAEEVRAFVAAARAFAARHPHKAVRMFIFNMAKGVEHFAARERDQPREVSDAAEH